MPSPPSAPDWASLLPRIRSLSHESQWRRENPGAEETDARWENNRRALHQNQVALVNVTRATELIWKPVLQLEVLSQMGKNDTQSHLMGRECWNETSKSESRVLPLLSIDNRYTSCLERKQQTCGVFGLELSVTGIANVTLKSKHKPKEGIYI